MSDLPWGTLVSVNVGKPRLIKLEGRTIETSIWKDPVEGLQPIRGVNIGDDVQSDLTVHGGVDKAIYSYGVSDYEWWGGELGRELDPGTFGENLTIDGFDVSSAVVGEKWRVGTALLEVSEPRYPCFKLSLRMDDPRFLKRFARAARPGAYLRIIEEGEAEAGDSVEVIERPDHGVTMSFMSDVILFDHSEAARLLKATQLAPRWREHVAELAERAAG